MASLDSVISAIFNGSSYNSHIRNYRRALTSSITARKYMEIPINTDDFEFELPLLAFDDFIKMHQNRKEGDVLVASLYSCGLSSTYKSLDSIMKDVLSTSFDKHLCTIQITGSPNIYYATFGAVFDENFTPLMMLSWVMEKRTNSEGIIKYHYKRPLLRLNPHPCINKGDALQRFLASRMLTTTLSTTAYIPYFYNCDGFIEQHRVFSIRDGYHIKVEIDECPFTIKGIDTPSISITNEDLLQLAADHIDEVLQ
jgi:hypothetical protein